MKYKIKAGRHYANLTLNRLWPFGFRNSDWYIKFSPECANAEVYIPGWNKLTGVSGLFIHKNSARFVWQPGDDGWVRIAAYVYDNGERVIKEIGQVKVDREIWMGIHLNSRFATFRVLGYQSTAIPVKIKWPLFQCFPYFGGQCTAPEDLTIEIKDI